MKTDTENKTKTIDDRSVDQGRRKALAKLGMLAVAAYAAPMLMTLSEAHASSGGGSGSGMTGSGAGSTRTTGGSSTTISTGSSTGGGAGGGNAWQPANKVATSSKAPFLSKLVFIM